MAFRILSVDDEMDMQELLRQKFRKKIRKGEYEFFFATNGEEAIELLQNYPNTDMVLADINMPVMDGLSMLTEISKLNLPMLKVVMISAYGDMRNIRMAMNRGAFDFINKPIDFADLELTIIKTKDRIDYLKSQQKELNRLTSFEHEVKSAARIQAELLPDINGFCKKYKEVEIGSFIKPAKFIGGDFYNVLHIDDKHIGFVIADVSGKGIIAASFMLLSSTAISIYGQNELNPNTVLQKANEYMAKDNAESMFTTVFYGILNIETGIFSYSNAGHNPPMLLRDDKIEVLESTSNPAIGVMEGINYNSKELQLKPNDLIFMFTDGVSEAQNIEDEEYGERRIQEVVLENTTLSPENLNNAVFASLEDFRGNAEQFDDITIYSFRYRG